MIRFAVLLGAMAFWVVLGTPTVTTAHPDDPIIMVDCDPTAGTGPMSIALAGEITGWVMCYQINYGDGFSETIDIGLQDSCWDFVNTVEVELAHEFTCPGEYVVTLYAMGVGGEATTQWTVLVSAPVFELSVSGAASADLPAEISVQTRDDVRFDTISTSVVNWGDGSSPEEFVWILQQGTYLSPAHTFTESGVFLVTVTNNYTGENCTHSESSSITVTAGSVTPVETTTWGRIKSVYGGRSDQ